MPSEKKNPKLKTFMRKVYVSEHVRPASPATLQDLLAQLLSKASNDNKPKKRKRGRK